MPPATTPFDRLPQELSQIIFSLACRDDGTTGRSLSLVSRSVSHLSKPLKYQCLAIRNVRQALRVAVILNDTDPSYRCVIHLFVRTDYRQMYDYALCREDYYANNVKKASSPSQIPPFRRLALTLSRLLPGQNNGIDPFIDPIVRRLMLEADMTQALLQILTVISPSLQSLTLLIHQPYRELSLAGLPPLPSLQELTLMYTNTSHPQIPPYGLLQSIPRPFHSLKRLHLEWFDSGCGPLDLLAQIARLAPGLTHVRLPCLNIWWHRLLNADATQPQRFLSTAQQIHLLLPVSLALPRTPIATMALEECRAWAATDGRIVLEAPELFLGKLMSKMKQRQLESDTTKLRRWWVMRINGGEGCWSGDRAIC